ncbi:MAG: LCP family protein [Clostridia bacterium]|nr:LCP family protein [Clostridia bacterium]
MHKKDIINFAPTGEKKKKQIPGHVTLIIVLCLLAFAVSVFIILAVNDFDIGRALGAREAETTLPAEESTIASDIEDDTAQFAEAVNFLLLCSNENELTFCQIVSVDAANNKIRIKPLPLDYSLELNSGKKNITAAFKSESLSILAAAFSSRNVTIKKYVHVTEENFKRLMSNLGAVPVEIDGNYEFNIDAVKYTFSPGVQNMTSDMLLKYMKFAQTGEAALRLQGHTVASIFRQHFSQQNYMKGESFFSTLINLVDTNITAFDYGAAQDVLSSMLSGTVEIAVVS